MQTGYNTDVQFEGATYHVQTEDRGLENPLIDTLVYCGGRILFQEKQSYEDLLGQDDPVTQERVVAERLDLQHREFVRRARHGEFAEQQPTLGGILEAGGSFLEALDRFVLTDPEVENLDLSWKPSNGPLSGTLKVAHSGDAGDAVSGALVTARLIARSLAPVTVFQGETDKAGLLEIAIPEPPGPATALIFAAEWEHSAGRLRVSLD